MPLALADLHRTVQLHRRVRFIFDHQTFDHQDNSGDGCDTSRRSWSAIVRRGGFDVDQITETTAAARRVDALPDHVGPGLRVLVVGLNPSIYSAGSGVAYGRPGNRFWPAALASGLVSTDRDPIQAVTNDRVGFTDLVRRPTRRADELSRSEFIDGHRELIELVDWLAPHVICVVGLGGWRAAVDRSTTAGVQNDRLSGRPVYVMPSTSGLNASSSLEDLTEHLRTVKDLSESETCR